MHIERVCRYEIQQGDVFQVVPNRGRPLKQVSLAGKQTDIAPAGWLAGRALRPVRAASCAVKSIYDNNLLRCDFFFDNQQAQLRSQCQRRQRK